MFENFTREQSYVFGLWSAL